MNLEIKSFQSFRGSNFSWRSWRSAQTLTLPTVASTVSFTLALTMHGTSGFRGTKCELRGSQSFFRAFTTLLKIQKVKTSSVFPDNCIAVLCNEKLTCPYSHDPSRRPMAWQVPWQNDSPRVHREGKISLNSAKEMARSLHLKVTKNIIWIFKVQIIFSI